MGMTHNGTYYDNRIACEGPVIYASYMSLDHKRFTISEVAADWHMS